MKNKTYKFKSNNSISELRALLPEKIDEFSQKVNPILYEKTEDNVLKIGVTASDHSGGYWFNGEMMDLEDGGCIIEGEITFKNRYNKKEEKKNWFITAVYYLCFAVTMAIIIVPMLIIMLWDFLFKRKQNGKYCIKKFMTDYLACEKMKVDK